MTTIIAPQPEIDPSRSAYNGMVVAAPMALAAWLVVLCGVLLLV